MSTAHAYSMTELWTAHTPMALWKVSLIVLFFLLCGLVLCFAHWCILRGFIMEYGYPRLKTKTLKKRLKNDPFPQNWFVSLGTMEYFGDGTWFILAQVSPAENKQENGPLYLVLYAPDEQQPILSIEPFEWTYECQSLIHEFKYPTAGS